MRSLKIFPPAAWLWILGGLLSFSQTESLRPTHHSAADLFSSEEFQAMLIPVDEYARRIVFSPMTWPEFNTRLAGTAETEIPAEWDYRALGFVSPVKMQEACWVFSAIGTVESAIMIHNGGRVVDLSEEEITSCHPNGETGGMEYYAFAYILRKGIADEARYPWDLNDSTCRPPAEADYFINDYFIMNVTLLPLPDRVRLIKRTLLDIGPVSAGFLVYEDFVTFAGRGVYVWDGNTQTRGGHAVMIVGWKDDPSVVNGGYWICKNSWSTDWGEDGFFRIAYGQAGIDDMVQYVAYDPDEPAPIFRIKGGCYYLQTGQSFNLDINARSNRGAEAFYSAENLPAGASYDRENGSFSWTPAENQTGTFTVMFYASDGLYLTGKEFTFIVSDYY